MEFSKYGSRDYDIRESLRVWREERHIEVVDQYPGFLGNVTEEMTELLRAQTEEEKVDALCDIMIFSLNVIGNNFPITHVCYKLGKLSLTYGTYDDHILLLYRILGYQDGVVEKASGLLYACRDLLTYLGYDYQACLEETIKEISSRTGRWDTSISKFVKDTSEEAKAKWYKANYSNCKKGCI